jgi:DNA-binding beta-propeller fold protein YncE
VLKTTDSSRLSLSFLSLSVVSLALCALGATAHYLKWDWGNPWQLVGWLLSMLFLLIAFLPGPRKLGAYFRPVIKPKTAFFVFWIVFFVVAHLWSFRTAPWNGDGIFDDPAVDLLYLKTTVTSQPFQAAWFHPYGFIARETLFHYYVWPWLYLFGYNILTNEAALLALWCVTFLFTLLLTDLFFESYIVTSLIALVFTFLPFAFIYTFVGYHYEMTAPLCVASLYFLHVGFKTDSSFCLAVGGIAAGLCLASSLLGKQYVLALLGFVVLYAVFDRKRLKQDFKWRRVLTVIYGFAAGAMPILAYIVFNRHDYAYHELPFLDRFWQAVCGHGSPNDMTYYMRHLWSCFFAIPGPSLFFPDTLPIPLPYYWLLLPGFALALWQKRFEIVLLATIPVIGVFISAGSTVEHRLLLGIPFWIILIGFGLNSVTQLRLPLNAKIFLWGVSVLLLALGLVPAIQYIYRKAKDPSSISWFKQQEVAVARFLKAIVAGKTPARVPRLEHDEFNRVQGVPDPPYETLICANESYWILHLFLHDYDEEKILSFCGGTPMFVMSEQYIWNRNKTAIANYAPSGKDLKLIWETGAPGTESIIRMFQSLRELGTEDSLSFSFGGRVRTFYVLNIPSENIPEFRQLVSAFPATPDFTSLPQRPTNTFQGGKGIGRGQFDSPTGIAVDGSGNVLVADTNNGRLEKFSATGTFLSILGTKGTGQGQLRNPNGIAVDRMGNIYVADAFNHRVEKLAPDGTFIAEWKGPEPGFYGPRRIAIGLDDSIYIVDQGHTRIAKFDPDGQVLAVWGTAGSGNGQFSDPTSVAVDRATNEVYVADPRNQRIQVFDDNGKFLTKWSVPEWGQPAGFEDLAIDAKAGRLYASSANMDTVFVFDLKGNRIGSLTPKQPDKLEGPSALALTDRKLYVLNMVANRVSVIDLQ